MTSVLTILNRNAAIKCLCYIKLSASADVSFVWNKEGILNADLVGWHQICPNTASGVPM